LGGKLPVVNDELAYEGRGDGWSEEDVIEAHLGTFLGGGYGTTGFKDPVTKQGHYFSGAFSAAEHNSADNLLWLREIVDEAFTFWMMEPVTQVNFGGGRKSLSIFRDVHEGFRALEWRGREYLLGTNRAWPRVSVRLPEGNWQIRRYDVLEKVSETLTNQASGTFEFEVPHSRAVLFHVQRVD
jgi:hypothetical protein